VKGFDDAPTTPIVSMIQTSPTNKTYTARQKMLAPKYFDLGFVSPCHK
jgi:hypothetical protein